MLLALVILQAVAVLLLLVLSLRKPKAGEADPGLSHLPEQLSRLVSDEARRTREDNAGSAAQLRKEVIESIATLGAGLKDDLKSFREDNTTAAATLRSDVEQRMHTISQSFSEFRSETVEKHRALEESVNAKLISLMERNTVHQDKLRTSVEERLNKLNTDNAAKLEEMRATVDEKLHATLQTRLTESFGQVTDQLNKVHAGLGEMSKLSEGVDGLSRIFTNVKSRGGFAEVHLGMLLRQMLAPGQFIENASVRPGSLERVEFAVRLPTSSGERLMPIDAKFPREDWERLEAAYESNDVDAIAREGRAFENSIRTQAEKICDKYINPPATTPYAVMFLPTEGLYAEVIRRDALQAEIQSRCHVTIAGPTTLSAILTSFQMGFHMLALQEKGDEVWKILEGTKTEFKTFEVLMGKMESQVGTVQNTIQKLGVRTRAINRTLREVSDPAPSLPGFEDEFNPTGFSLAAAEDEA
ncbi:MAG TPA: DNA recombination protein RmuC [Acidobacteriaceae bacterium]|nr:DNA recombination protein RmuC [Acidobacteriaceae bacterium]